MAKEIKRWLQKPPVRCDVCNRPFTEEDKYFFDAKTRQGPWACMCSRCFNLQGIGLGVGMGQKYSFKTLEQVAGGKAQALEPVRSLGELRSLAAEDARYLKLLCIASSNLGGPAEGIEACFQWLNTNANETNSEEGVVNEVNGCIYLVDGQMASLELGTGSLKGVRSMPELRRLCRDHEEYQRVVIEVSGRLQGPETSFNQAWRWLVAVAMAGSDANVLKEVNECIRGMGAT